MFTEVLKITGLDSESLDKVGLVVISKMIIIILFFLIIAFYRQTGRPSRRYDGWG